MPTIPSHARARVDGPFYYRFDDGNPAERAVTSEPGEGDGWTRVDELEQIPPNGGRSLWLCMELPDVAVPNATLHLPRVYIAFDAYVDGAHIGGDHDRDAGGHAFHMLPLDKSEGWLSLHMRSDFSKTGIRGQAHVGSRADHIQEIVMHDAPRSAIVVILLAVGLASLLFAVRRERRSFLGFAGWAVCVAAWTFFYTQIREVLWPNPRAWVLAWGLALAWVVPAFLLFFNASFQRGERWLTWAHWLTTASAAIGSVVLVWRVPLTVANPFLQVHRVLVSVVFVSLVYVLFKRIREGDREAAILGAGITVYAVVGLRDILVALSIVNAFDVWAPWGMLIFLASGGVVLQRRLVALRDRADRDAAQVAVDAHERELMLRDMHDGLGRITTSISLLAEVARRDPDREGPLDSISALARDGSEEIRVFMRGLDDEDRDWSGLESHLRERASQLVEALGGSYDVDTSVASGAPEPSSYLYVHLLRVFHEGLTNALKHADAPNVRASLDVTASSVTLSLRNDRVERGDADHGVNLGAGLTSMRSRVAELGGDLHLEVNDGEATLNLQIPLPLRYAGEHPQLGRQDSPRDRGR